MYMYKYRRNTIFCPEMFFLTIGFIVSFFDVLMIDYSDQSRLLLSFLSDRFPKTRYLSMIGVSVFVNGLIYGNHKSNQGVKDKDYFKKISKFDTTNLSVLVLLLLVVTFFSGAYVAIFKYQQDVNHSDGLYGLLFTLMCSILMVATIIEFVKLKESNYEYTSFKNFLSKLNRVYFFDVLFISVVLLATGNRNDMLLFCLPPIILFYYLVKRISNKLIVGGVFVGFFTMVLIGLTRNNNSSITDAAGDINLYNTFRDFDAAYVDQYFLIEHTDVYGPVGFANGVNTVVSSIPFVGGILLDEKKHTADKLLDSNIVTTDYLNPGGAGMGTSLFGDLYYCGGLPFFILYMFLLGYMLSYVAQELLSGRTVPFFLLVCFCFYFANISYLLRATWYSMFRLIGFTIVIYLITSLLSQKKQI